VGKPRKYTSCVGRKKCHRQSMTTGMLAYHTFRRLGTTPRRMSHAWLAFRRGGSASGRATGSYSPTVSVRPNIYSYADAGEAILAHYLVQEGKKPSDIRQIVHMLREEHGRWPLATAPLAHDGRLVVAKDRKRGVWMSVDRPGHDVIGATLLNLKVIREALSRGGWVTLDHPRKYVEVDPDRHSGEPVIRAPLHVPWVR
jgi:hypothetical protein